MYIYEWNKVGHRYFQRPLSCQGSSVFRQVRRGDAVQTTFTSGRAGWHRRGGRHPPASQWAAFATGTVPARGSGHGVALCVRRSHCSAGCWCVSVRHTAPCQPRGWVCASKCALQPGGWLGKGLSRGNLGMESEFWSTWIHTRFCTVYV